MQEIGLALTVLLGLGFSPLGALCCLSMRDALIAATGLVHGLTAVTRNVADFAHAGVPVLNLWDEER